MKTRVFQMVTAVAEINRSTGEFVLAHGAFFRSGFFASCEWTATLPRPDLAEARAQIAAHLNECSRFGWPLLPHVVRSEGMPLPSLTARDVLPGTNLDTEDRIHFGVTTDDFEIG